jgi:hypothetical protein
MEDHSVASHLDGLELALQLGLKILDLLSRPERLTLRWGELVVQSREVHRHSLEAHRYLLLSSSVDFWATS